MSVLSAATEQQVQQALVSSGMLTSEKLQEAKITADKDSQPLFTFLVKNNYITDEQLTKANATITKVPYVNLTSARIDPAVLSLLPQDIAERYMAVPLGEIQHRLVVAMLDADNVQAVDFLSNRIGRP
ncbi:type II secretion system protein E, partial [Candidatus Saccharibacteria bacterium CG_4_10_14_0_2_um_filter_52_9]